MTAGALEESLGTLRSGGDVAGVLRTHPAEREELMSLLQAGLRLSALEVPAPDRGARLRGRNRMLARAEKRRLAGRLHGVVLGGIFSRRAVRLGSALALAGGLMGGAITASADSMPGQPLYAIKPAVEQVELALTWDPAANTRLRLAFAARRLEEAQHLVALGRAREALALIDEYDAAVGRFGAAPALPRTQADADDLTRFLDADRELADARLSGLASRFQAGGDADSAAAVEHARSRVDEALRAWRLRLQSHDGTVRPVSPSAQPSDRER